MDDIDQYFDDAACDAFVQGMNFDMGGTGASLDETGKREFGNTLLESDETLYASLIGPNYEKEIKEGWFSKLSEEETIHLLENSELSGVFFAKDTQVIRDFLIENLHKDKYSHTDLLVITRMLIKTNI